MSLLSGRFEVFAHAFFLKQPPGVSAACDHDDFAHSRTLPPLRGRAAKHMYLCHFLLPAPASLYNQTSSHPRTVSLKATLERAQARPKGTHKADHLGGRYLSCQASDGHGNPTIARIPHREFLLVRAVALGPKHQNSHKHRAKRFICHTKTGQHTAVKVNNHKLSLCSSQKYSMSVLLFTLRTYTPVHCVFLNFLIRMYCMTYTLSWECVQPFKTNPTKHQTSMDDIFWAKSGQLVKAFKNMPLHI